MATPTTLISTPALILEGLRLLWHRQLRWIVLIPILLNGALFISATLAAIDWADSGIEWMINQVPQWLSWLMWLLWLLFAGLLLVVYAFTFTMLANLIGSPFYGIIVEKVIALERGQLQEQSLDFSTLIKVAKRSFVRELHKLAYFLPRSLAVALLTVALGMSALLSFAGPIVAALWGAWSLGLQYLDYPADVDGVNFPALRAHAAEQRGRTISFGFAALGAAAIPLVNLLLLPATVVAGTLLWCRQFNLDSE